MKVKQSRHILSIVWHFLVFCSFSSLQLAFVLHLNVYHICTTMSNNISNITIRQNQKLCSSARKWGKENGRILLGFFHLWQSLQMLFLTKFAIGWIIDFCESMTQRRNPRTAIRGFSFHAHSFCPSIRLGYVLMITSPYEILKLTYFFLWTFLRFCLQFITIKEHLQALSDRNSWI